MNIAIVGSRDYEDVSKVVAFVKELPKGTVVISGGARGVDTIAEASAQMFGLETKIFKADWATYGKQAGFLRNRQIVDLADRLVAFWDGQSRGTAHSIQLGYDKGIPVEVIK